MLSKIYDDTFDIYRMSDTVGADKITRQSLALAAADIAGHLSLNTADKTGAPTKDVNEVKSDYILFCAQSVDIRTGDTIVIRGLSCLAGLPHTYPLSHQQVPLEYKGEA